MIARAHRAHDRCRNRCHAGCCRPRSLCAFKCRNSAFEHLHRRVGKTGINEPVVLAEEPRLALFCAVVDMALGQEQRLGCLAKLRAEGALVHKQGFGTEGADVFGVRHQIFPKWCEKHRGNAIVLQEER